MRIIVALILFLFIGWFALAALLIGYIPLEVFPERFQALALPVTTAELGDSLSLLNGLSTTAAILVAFLAILFQARELKLSTQQLKMSTQMSVYSSRLQFLFAEIERLEGVLENLTHRIDDPNSTEDKGKLGGIRNSSRDLQKRYRAEAAGIDKKLQETLLTLE